MLIESFISNRLSLRSGERKHFSPAIVVAIGGIALAFVVMLISIAVVTGFKNEIRRKIMGFDAQVRVQPLASFYGEEVLPINYNDAMRQVVTDALAGTNATASLTLNQAGLIKTPTDFLGVNFRSYDDGYEWQFEHQNLIEGVIPSEENQRGVLLSQSMMQKLQLAVGDKIDAYFFVAGTVRPRKLEVTGAYCSNFGDFDDVVAYAPQATLKQLLHYPDSIGMALEIRGLSDDEILPAAQRLQKQLALAYAGGKLQQTFAVTTVYASGAAYFNWLEMLDTNIVVILILMGCVSGFMLISCVLILILERVKMIGQLKALGADNRQIRGIFIRLGARVTGIGLLVGNVLALVLIAVQAHWHLLTLDPQSYYLSYVPIELTWQAWLLLNVGAAIFAFALMLLPTSLISRLSPVKVMRFE